MKLKKTYLINPALMLLLHPVHQVSDRNPILLQ